MAKAQKLEDIDWAGLMAAMKRKYVGDRRFKYEAAVEGRSIDDQIAEAIAMMVAAVSKGKKELPCDQEQLLIIAGMKLKTVRNTDAKRLARRRRRTEEFGPDLSHEEQDLLDVIMTSDGRDKLVKRLLEELAGDSEATEFLKLYVQPHSQLKSNQAYAEELGTEPLRIKYLKRKIADLSRRISANELGPLVRGRSS